MKITKKQYPVLRAFDKKWLKENTFGVNYYYQAIAKQIPKYIFNNIENYLNDLLSGLYLGIPIYYVSKQFHQATFDNEDKLNKLVEDQNACSESFENCVILVDSFAIACANYTFTVFDKGGVIYAIIIVLPNGQYKTCYFHNFLAERGIHETWLLDIFFRILLFKKFASVDLVYVEKGKKKKTSLVEKGKIINDTDVDIIYLDSKWFREIIRNEGFKVRGHFRLQPYKDENGKWTRKLIYINEFEKHGYHRKAKISVEQETIEQSLS